MTVGEIIERIRRFKQEFDGDVFPGADEHDLQRFKGEVKRRCGVILPDDYLALLRQVNGLSHDGCEIYGSKPMFATPDQEYPTVDGLVEANEGMELDEVAIPNGLAFGLRDSDVYGLDIPSNTFGQYDVYRKPLKRYASFEEMFIDMFASRA